MNTRTKAIVLAACSCAAVTWAAQPQAQGPATRQEVERIRITISPATTVVSGPVNPDGTIDYLAALDAQASKGVTPDNNAAVGLVRALNPWLADTRDEVLKRLQMPPLPEDGDYFVRFEQYLKQEGVPETDLEQMGDRRDQAMRAPWTDGQYPEVAAWLRANDKPLALVVAATKRPRYYMPLVSHSQPPQMIAVSLPNLGVHREAARALVARAMGKLGVGDVDAAREDLLAVHRLARLMGQGPTLIEHLVAIAIENLASEADESAVTVGGLTPAQCGSHLAALQALEPLPPTWKAVNTDERFRALDGVMCFARKRTAFFDTQAEPLPIRNLDWDALLRTLNAHYDRIVTIVRIPEAAKRQAAAQALNEELEAMKPEGGVEDMLRSLLSSPELETSTAARKQTTEAVGKVLMALFTPNLTLAKELCEESVMRSELVQVAFALELARAEDGAYPDKLGDLAPGHLRAVPVDRFTGTPPIYKRVGNGYALYSVGRNLVDDGGNESEDIVVRVK